MKKLYFSVAIILSITIVSCSNDDVETNSKKIKSNFSEIQKPSDTIGGQGGTFPPPPPPIKGN